MVLSRGRRARPDRPTALWVLPVADVGGVTRHALDVARVGIPGWRLEVVLPPGPAVAALRRTGAGVTVAPIGPAAGLRRSATAYRSVLRRLRPDLVHSHLAYADLLVAATTPARRTPLVSTEHGIAGDDRVHHHSRRRAALRAALHRARLHRVDAVIAVSHATRDAIADTWRPGAGTAVHVVLNGVDPAPGPDHTGPDRADGPHVVSLTRLAPEKGLDHLLDSFALLARERPAARLTLAGTGPLEAHLRQRIARLGLTERVRMPGVVDAATLLRSADVLAQLSAWENCSYSLLDALAHGVGVVASPVGGNPELVAAGSLVDAADHPAVARALLHQAVTPAARPALPAGWPDVATMSKLVGEVYAEVLER